MADPIIYSRDESGLRDAPGTDNQGRLGEIYAVTLHHSAGPRATSKARCQSLNRSYQIAHINKGWGDIGYHFCMDDLGRFYRLRSTRWKGTHVGGWNTGNVGIMLHGNYVNGRNEINVAQRQAVRWLFQGGFYKLFGEPEAGISLVRGHNEWNGHNSNACPGHDIMRYLNWLRTVEDW
jgi:N-acetylmuramoyl-L-alanine amidase